VPSIVLPRFLENHASKIEHARKLEKVIREVGGDANVAEERKRFAPSAVDAMRMRGIPCVGPGSAGGVIVGTQPERALLAKQRD
jgi:hypothetical protein